MCNITSPSLSLTPRVQDILYRNGAGTMERKVDELGTISYVPAEHESGYYVGTDAIAEISGYHNLDDLKDFYCPEEIRRYPSEYLLGLWWSEEDGLWYVDVSLHFSDLSEALSAAKEYSQIAVFDIANGGIIEV